MIVKLREPVKYSNIDSEIVQAAGVSRYPNDYRDPRKVTIDMLYDVMVYDYLNNGFNSHQCLAFNISNRAMSQNSYKSIIDNECVMLGVFRSDESDSMHTVVLNQYSISNGIVSAYCQDPFAEERVQIEWVDDWLTYEFGMILTQLKDHITSYY